MSLWFSISGMLSCVLSSVLLIPDCLSAIHTGEVSMSKNYLFLKGLILANNIQYSVSIGITFGWYAAIYVGISTGISAACLCVLCHVKFREKTEDIYEELP